jgi:hypothetical protein
MIYQWLAGLIVVIHFLFILFALFGALLVLWRKWIIWLHLPAAVWAMLIEFRGWLCPLTPLENYFTTLAGKAGYEGGFIKHYLVPIIYPTGLAPHIQIILGGVVLAVNGVIYFFVFRRWYGGHSM